jgi:proteic killer suppression protein
VIRSFRHKGLRELFLTGKSAGVRPDPQKRARRILGALDQTQSLRDLSYPGLGTHPLHGTPRRYAIYINGPWRITFEFIEGEAWQIDLEQYH